MRAVTVLVAGDPVPKGRPRVTRDGHAYTPARTADYEAAIGWAWRELRELPFEGPVKLTIDVHERVYPADLDNYVKCLDALNGLAWADDVQVAEIHARIIRKCKIPQMVILIENA